MPRGSSDRPSSSPGSPSGLRELAERARYHAAHIRDDETTVKLLALAEELEAEAAAIEASDGR